MQSLKGDLRTDLCRIRPMVRLRRAAETARLRNGMKLNGVRRTRSTIKKELG